MLCEKMPGHKRNSGSQQQKGRISCLFGQGNWFGGDSRANPSAQGVEAYATAARAAQFFKYGIAVKTNPGILQLNKHDNSTINPILHDYSTFLEKPARDEGILGIQPAGRCEHLCFPPAKVTDKSIRSHQ
ncbi:MAG: hypothetical protein IH846_15920 [Acidobacteria bacterium]|nr:hypothetical protein [Acidobacteriota bacterium]